MAEVLVFIPGLGCDARAIWYQLVALSGDLPVMVAAPVAGESVEEMAAALLPSLPERMALVGQGLGGNVALEIQMRAPERVARIALMGVSVQVETPQAAAERELRIVAAQAGRLADAVAGEVPEAALAPGPDRAAVRQMLQDMAQTLGAEVFVRQSRALQRRPDRQKALRRMLLPALVLGGAEDPIQLPRRHEFIAEMLPYGRLQLIEGAGHLPALERPAQVTRALEDWLAIPLMR